MGVWWRARLPPWWKRRGELHQYETLQNIEPSVVAQCMYGTPMQMVLGNMHVMCCVAILFATDLLEECGSSQYQCQGSFCIPMDWRCDGDRDCLHADDEDGCENGWSLLRTVTVLYSTSTIIWTSPIAERCIPISFLLMFPANSQLHWDSVHVQHF